MKESDFLELDIAIIMEALVQRTPHDRDTKDHRAKMEKDLRASLDSWEMGSRDMFRKECIKALAKKHKLNPHPHPMY